MLLHPDYNLSHEVRYGGLQFEVLYFEGFQISCFQIRFPITIFIVMFLHVFRDILLLLIGCDIVDTFNNILKLFAGK